jgi:hypothetical protein
VCEDNGCWVTVVVVSEIKKEEVGGVKGRKKTRENGWKKVNDLNSKDIVKEEKEENSKDIVKEEKEENVNGHYYTQYN